MKVLRSNAFVIMLALVVGVITTSLNDPGVKYEIDAGVVGARIPLFVLASALAWLALMVARFVLLGRERQNG